MQTTEPDPRVWGRYITRNHLWTSYPPHRDWETGLPYTGGEYVSKCGRRVSGERFVPVEDPDVPRCLSCDRYSEIVPESGER
jgi:hypothetical protein